LSALSDLLDCLPPALSLFITEQKQKSKQLEMALEKSHNALHACDAQLAGLKAEFEEAHNCLSKWQKISDE